MVINIYRVLVITMIITEIYLNKIQESGFDRLPKGWTDKSIKKTGKTIAKDIGKETPGSKGFFDKCVKKMTGNIDNPEGYCASLKDEYTGSTYWRGKGKTKKKGETDIKRHQNV